MSKLTTKKIEAYIKRGKACSGAGTWAVQSRLTCGGEGKGRRGTGANLER
jgi:hypothetical protein